MSKIVKLPPEVAPSPTQVRRERGAGSNAHSNAATTPRTPQVELMLLDTPGSTTFNQRDISAKLVRATAARIGGRGVPVPS